MNKIQPRPKAVDQALIEVLGSVFSTQGLQGALLSGLPTAKPWVMGVLAEDLEAACLQLSEAIEKRGLGCLLDPSQTPLLSARREVRLCLDSTTWALPGWEDEPLHQGYFVRIFPVFSWDKRPLQALNQQRRHKKGQRDLCRHLVQEAGIASERLPLLFPQWGDQPGAQKPPRLSYEEAWQLNACPSGAGGETDPLWIPVDDWRQSAYPLQLTREKWPDRVAQTQAGFKQAFEPDFKLPSVLPPNLVLPDPLEVDWGCYELTPDEIRSVEP